MATSIDSSGVVVRGQMTVDALLGESYRDITEVRQNFSETVNQVAYGKGRVTITRHGKALVALVPIEDLELLERLEDHVDLEKTRAALKEVEAQGVIPWEQVKANLGL